MRTTALDARAASYRARGTLVGRDIVLDVVGEGGMGVAQHALAENSSSDAQRHAELAGYEAAGGVTNAVLGARSSD